ncbi:MAG: hypothetical protein RSC11_07720 [Mucinivorans sp.]
METTKVFARLKPKAASLGFNDKELEGVAAQIANNLTSDDATDTDIDAAIAAALPYLSVAQAAANRTIEAARKKTTPNPKSDESHEDPADKTPPQNTEPEWFKSYREKQEGRITQLEQSKLSEQFDAALNTRFASIDKEFYQTALEGRHFQTQDEVDAFAQKVETNWQAYSQKLANEGLSRMSKPQSGEKPKEDTEAVADLISAGTKQIVEQKK